MNPSPCCRYRSFGALLLALAAFVGCGSGGDRQTQRQFVTLGTAPVGGAFQPVGNAIASVLNEFKGDNQWRLQAKGTKGSQQNIRMLDKGEIQLGMSNSAISYYAVRGEGVWDKPYDIRAVVTLAPNVGLFITKQGSGIKTIADLKGKRVTVGPSGAGFDMFLKPIFNEHGVEWTEQKQEFTPLNEVYSAAVTLLGDGNADAAFMGGAIPTPAVTQACTSHNIAFIPYDDAVLDKLINDYPFYNPVTIPATNKDGNPTYKGMTADFKAMNVGSMQLITHADEDEETIYQITKTIWENRTAIAKQHGAGRAINEENAARYTGTEFHPGAIRFYQEIGIWSAAGAGYGAATGPTVTPQPEKPEAEKPEAEKPEAEKPEAEKPEAEKPEAGKPEAGKPEAGKPEAGKPEAGKPEAGKPEAEKPEAEKPEAEKPEAEKPEAGKPEAEKPEAGKSEPPGESGGGQRRRREANDAKANTEPAK